MNAATVEVIAPPPRRGLARLRWHFAHRQSAFWLLGYGVLVMVCLFSLWQSDDLSLGRRPWANLLTTVGEMSKPSFLDVWFGKTIEFKSDDGTVLRVENRQATERTFLLGLLVAMWTTIKIATLGTLLAALTGMPLGVMAANNMQVAKPLQVAARLTLDVARSIHALVFGLLIVGIIGLGPTAGILAIGLHAMGTWGKLFAESIETLDMRPLEALRATGATPVQVFLFGAWPALMPSVVSNHLYIWEYNIRDSTVLGLIGAGGLGLLVTEAVSLFQWGRLSTTLMAIVVMVIAFDALSRRIRHSLL
ncbi:MAG: phosphonate ABC transporter, permease protein PhnE [Betaproteobacteria bacterium]|nr:phosphonate ABC transporter, permease protein PhnE [Betaproteobacteria bacterium]